MRNSDFFTRPAAAAGDQGAFEAQRGRNIGGDRWVPGGTARRMPGNAAGNAPGNMPGNAPGNMPGNAPGNMSGSMAGNMPGNAAGNAPGNMSGSMAGNMPGNAPGNMSGSMAGNTPGNAAGNMPGRDSEWDEEWNETPQTTPRSTAQNGDLAQNGEMLNQDGIQIGGMTEEGVQVTPGTTQWLLSEHVGYFVICDFLVGTQQLVTRQGILYRVGPGFMVLYDDVNDNYTVCDFYSLKFITFYDSTVTPRSLRNARR